ncbi:hypothetical protein Ddye_021160 [Dipteronia dyeriana]|uniref:DUF1985 domain-containing protein n=1 Tax=Dipteronia dyeriana TaxID=168575 RepID=A0AAD9U130_9ROSI|nr:hypothetical protein Ddye_021160 [Dipteronia dyeriana]
MGGTKLLESLKIKELTFGAYSESTLEIFKRKNSRLRRSYFQDSKVHVKMIIDWFRNLGPNNKYSDDDIEKLTLILILEMTFVGKDDKTSILYWALELVDDLDAFNKFPWGSFLYDRTFNSLSTCLLGRDDKFKNKFIDKLKEKVDGLVKRKVERYNVYGFVTAFQNSLMDEMRMGFLYLTELICLNKVAEMLNEENIIDVSQNENIHDYQPSVSRVVKSPEFVVVSETSEDVKQLTKPPKLTIKVPRDHKPSAFTVSPYIDPTAKRPRKPKMPEFGSISQMDDDIVRSMQSSINDNKNTCMYTGLLEAKPAWFELLLSKNGWLKGDTQIQGRWSTVTKGKKQFKHETYQ